MIGARRLAGECAVRPQVGGFADAPGGFGAADQCPLGDRMGEFAAQLFWGGLVGQFVDQRVLCGR